MVNTLKPTILHELTAYIERLKKNLRNLIFLCMRKRLFKLLQ